MGGRNIILGLIFVLLGGFWLLGNLGLVYFNIFDLVRGLMDLWPLILVVIGINIMVKNKLVNGILWIVFIVSLTAYSFFIQPNDFKMRNEHYPRENTSIEMNESTKEAVLDLELGAVRYQVDSNNNGEDLVKIDSKGGYNYKKESKGKTQILKISNDPSRTFDDNQNNLDIHLAENLPWTLDIETGASSGELHLEELNIENLNLELGAGKIDIYLGKMHPKTNINIESGVSKIAINLPKEAGLRVEMDGGLNSTNLNRLNLEETQEKVFVSKNYMDAKSKYDIKVEMGLGSFTINRE